jgi:hypothetical protein
MGKGLWSVTHCFLCKGGDLEDITRIDNSTYR